MKSVVITIIVIAIAAGLIVWLYCAAQAITAGSINMKKKLRGEKEHEEEEKIS